MDAKKKLRALCDNLDGRLHSLTDRLDAWEMRHEKEMEDAVGIDGLATIRASKESAVEMLEHSDPKHRLVALDVLGSHWRVAANERCVTRILDMASSDPDVGVRACALSTLGICYRGTDDSRIGRILAAVVQNSSHPKPLRYSAYFGLLQLQYRSPVTLARFPENVDHVYVDGFFQENRVPNPVGDNEAGILKEWGWTAQNGCSGPAK